MIVARLAVKVPRPTLVELGDYLKVKAKREAEAETKFQVMKAAFSRAMC